jgi:hypothetical protein
MLAAVELDRYETERNAGDRVEVKREKREGASVRSGKKKDAIKIEVSRISRLKDRVVSQCMTCNCT